MSPVFQFLGPFHKALEHGGGDLQMLQDVSRELSFLPGKVEYLGFSAPTRGSGTQVGTFKMHKYRMTCRGYGPSNAESQVEAGFYRIGF